MASVELVGVSKSFGPIEVIHGIDVAIADGEFLALVGPSGCGKSTLLRIISGLEAATDGEVRIDGHVVNALNPRERNIAMVFQNYALYPHMTVEKNMGFNLKLSGMPRHERRAKVEEAARLLEIYELLDRRPGQLSGGQRQRVAMGRAIVRDPEAFLFDEPLSNLDAKLRVQMRAEIKTLHQKVRTTSIYVTHDQIEAMTLADRIVVLNQGYIEQQGTPRELYRHPANIFVASFIGTPSMNFLDAKVLSSDSGPMAELADGTIITLPSRARVTAGQNVTIGIRPEHIVQGNDGTTIRGTTTIVEPTGAQAHMLFELAGQQLTAVVDGETTLEPGLPFIGAVNPDLIHVFSREGGQSLTSEII